MSHPPRNARCRWLFVAACLVCGLLLQCPPARAYTCSASSPGTQSLGNVSPVSGLAYSTSGTITVTCTVAPAEGLLAGTHIIACLSIGGASGSSPRTLVNGANSLQYNLYSDSAHTQIIGSAAAAPPNPVAVDFNLGLLGILLGGTSSQSVSLYTSMPSGQTSLQAGNYSQSFSGGNAAVNYTAYTGTTPTCSAAWTSGGSFPFTVSATVINDCNITATNIDFGASGVLGVALSANGTLTAQCTSGDSYSIALNRGATAGASLNDRLMSTGGGSVVHYQLYTAASYTTIWGDGTSGTSTVGSTGSGATQSYTVFGSVAAQTTPAPGSYSDTITATITY